VYEQMNGEQEVNYAKALDVGADAAMLRGLYSVARRYVERSTAVRQKTVGQTHLTMAQSHSRAAELLILEDQLAEAEPHLEQALAIRQRACHGEHPLIAQRQKALGRRRVVPGRSPRAAELHGEALRLQATS